MTQELQMIKLMDLRPNPSNFGQVFDGPEFDEFVASVNQQGVIQIYSYTWVCLTL